MAYCRECGAPLQEGTKFCSECGAPTESAPLRLAPGPAIEFHEQKPQKVRKPLVKRWWFWALVLTLVACIAGRVGGDRSPRSKAAPTVPVATEAPTPTSKPTAAPTSEPTAAPTPEPTPESAPEPTPEQTETIPETEIRPEVKEFLDSYEAFMNEYVEFMQKYQDSDAGSAASMLMDYYSFFARYAEFEEKIDAFEESDLTNAELAYYIEVTSRVSQKLLSIAG